MILFDTVEQVASAYQMISGDPAVFKAKNRFEKPTDDGYRDILMVVNVGGHLCELQLNTQAILTAKEQGLGHKLYEITRQLAPIAKDENNGDFAFMAMGYIDSFRKISVKLYRNAAMSSVISSASNMASDSEIDDEYKRILQQLSVSSISTHFPIDLPSIRKTQPVDFSIAKGTSSFSTNLKLSDSISNPPFDSENITRNGEKVNAKVITGRPTRAYLNDNDMLALQYAVIEAKNLVSSHNADFTLNPEFPAELQPRDRTRDSMKGQISSISNTLNPDRLGGSLNASVGAPIVGRDLVVESGNGRTMAIKQRYNKDGATEYKAWIIQNAGKFGFNPEKLAEIQQPVLVRIRLSGGDRKSITERANEADIASMSPMEQAKVDDSRLTAADMESFTPSKEGDIAAASNAGFIAKFIEKVGKAEAAGLLTADSRPTKALVDRIQCAIFSKAYADDRLLTLMAEETHPAVKNILTALTAAAPVFAKIRASYPDMGGIKLVDNIIEATRLMVQARDDGDGIEMILSQMGLFSQIPEETKTITRILNDNIRRSKHLGTVFKLAGERILTFLQDQNQVGLFGKEPPPTASEVITGAIARAAELDPANKQKGIFEDIGSTIGNLYDESLSLRNNNEKRIVYRKVTQDEAEKIKKETGHDISGYKRIISNYGIRHIDNRHGKDEGELAVKKVDILLIDKIIDQYDSVKAIKTNMGKDGLLYKKKIGKTYFFVEEIWAGKKILAVKTLYKSSSGGVDALLEGSPLSTRPKRHPDPGFSENILIFESDVKPFLRQWFYGMVLENSTTNTYPDTKAGTDFEFPRKRVESAYSHLHLSPGNTAIVEEGFLKATADEIKATINKYRPDMSKAEVDSAIGRFKRAYVAARESVWNAASNAYSGLVAGWSKLDKKQVAKRGASLDRAEEKFAGWLKYEILDIEGYLGIDDLKADESKRIAEKKADNKQNRKVSAIRQWMALNVGDEINVGNPNGNPKIKKKNKFSVETGSGAKWTIKDLFGIDHAEASEIMAQIKNEAAPIKDDTPDTSGISAPFGAITDQWRFSIRNAKTFQDIADVFNREFGVTLDDDADKNVNKIFESVTDTIAQDVTATKQPWEMTKDEYNDDYQDSPLQQSLIDKWENDSKTIKPKDRESFRATWWGKNNPHTQAVEQAMSDGLTVPDAVLNEHRNSPRIKWRIGIRKAKTFQDIADVFSDVFGVTLDDESA